MRKCIYFSILLSGLLLFAGCGKKDSDVEVTGVKLSDTSLSLTVGDEKQLTATVQPSNATNQEVTWTSSATDIATVANGLVKGVGEGVATITVTTADGSKTASCLVNVSYIHDSAVALDITEDQVLIIGDELVLTATVTPADAIDVSVNWETSDAETVSVTPGEVSGAASKATIKALKGGSATITVTTKDQGHSATLKVTVPGTSTNPGGSFDDDDYGTYK